jgi:molybdopterin-containing oxidoreductase family iron-sulfur binding subunit
MNPARWRSVEEKERSRPTCFEPEFRPGAAEMRDGASRREFLELAAATLALGGVAACTRQPPERIVPYVTPPEHIVPGKPLYYATALSERGYGTGVLVESHMGRPTKIEGNPIHPASLGAIDVWSQASILDLYDPGRSRVVRSRGGIGTPERFFEELAEALARERSRSGKGFRLLTGRIGSPTVFQRIRTLLHAFPEARWHSFEPLSRDNVTEGARLAFGRALVCDYDLEAADVVLSLDSDFLYSEPGHLRHARAFGSRRVPSERGLNRLYAAEPTPSVTGSMADHRFPVSASSLESLTRELALQLGAFSTGARSESAEWLNAVARDLDAHRGRSLVLAGDGQPAVVHALAHSINQTLGNIGRTVRLLEDEEPLEPRSLLELARDLESGQVEILVMIGVNPAYTAPADLDFPALLPRAGFSAHMGVFADETAALSHWHIPQAHELESWGDVRAYDGTVTLQQPLIEPLYGGLTPGQLLDAVASGSVRSSYDVVRETWRRPGTRDPHEEESWFRRALHDGIIEGSGFGEARAPVELAGLPPPSPAGAEGLEILFRPDPTILDGRHSGNAWLQELPKPITKLTWDNAVLLSAAAARRRGIENEQVVEIALEGRTVRGPAWILPGQAEETITLPLGYGRSLYRGLGFDAYRLRSSAGLWTASGATLRLTGERYRLAATQEHFTMEGRSPVRKADVSDLEELEKERRSPSPDAEASLYPEWRYEGYAWGMSIDLSSCIGCGACVVACQSENNIPSVGKDGVLNQREMHWIRVDRYFEGPVGAPDFHHQPVPCMHCENAPCEPVCPVTATVHSNEGLNEMVYNRCVGTRYCSNNCPYKVRRFNFLEYTRREPVLDLLRNPDVTVRSRGVMEKCTYCVQRINAARIEAKKEDRAIHDGEIATACESACPSRAIVFGDTADPSSRVAQRKRDGRSYGLLSELNTRPRTTYLKKLVNPNPQLSGP